MYFRNLRNLKIAPCKFEIHKLRTNLEIACTISRLRNELRILRMLIGVARVVIQAMRAQVKAGSQNNI